MLFLFPAAEDAARFGEVMSLALAGEAPPRPFGALLLDRLAGEAGLGWWLGQEPAALRALAAYFGDGPNELRAIAEEAERRIGLTLDRGPAASAPVAAGGRRRDGPPDTPRPLSATPELGPAPRRAPPPAIGGEGAGWEWINWVRAGLRDGSVAVNGAGAWLHNITGEAYVVAPACFEAAFAAERGLAPATVHNCVVRIGRHRVRASRSGAANIFRAVLADGRRVGGLVFPTELIWDDDPPPWANAELVREGRRPARSWTRLRRLRAARPTSPRRLVRSCGKRATRRPGNRREAGGAPPQ